MPEEENKNGAPEGPQKEPKVPARGWLVMLAILAFVPVLMMLKERSVGAPVELTISKFGEIVNQIKDDQEAGNGSTVRIKDLSLKPRPGSGEDMYQILGKWYPVDQTEHPDPERFKTGEAVHFRFTSRITDEKYNELDSLGLIETVPVPDTFWTSVLFNLVPFLILALFIYFFFVLLFFIVAFFSTTSLNDKNGTV